MLRRVLLSCLLLAPVGAAAHDTRLGELLIRNPWTRAAGSGGAGGGFLEIRNEGTTADRLVSATSAAARRMELHSMVRDGDVMRMREVDGGIEIPAGQTVTLQPGGLHLMLMGLTQDLRTGGTVPVTLTFARAGTTTVELSVAAAGARTAPAH